MRRLVIQRLIGENVPIVNTEVINKQQPTDQGELARIVISYDADAPLPIIQRHGIDLHQVVIVEILGKCGMTSDFLIAEGSRIGRVHTFQMLTDVGGQPSAGRVR